VPDSKAGYFNCGLPYNRLGHGARPLVVFQGLFFENKPQPGLLVENYQFLGNEYTVFQVMRKRGLPQGYTLAAMGDDYAAMIEEEFGGPVDVIGVSTGGSIAQHFAADHPDLVRSLVLHSSAYVLGDEGKRWQLRIGALAQQRRFVSAYAVIFGALLPHRGIQQALFKPLAWLGALWMAAMSAPRDPSDLVVTVAAEDCHNFKSRLAQITSPTLVAAGDKDPFYTPALFRETAAGIPNARLVLYPGVGHPASGRLFNRDVLAFLKDEAFK
jgi:pimeloyl-ACP methyl ester carboxylesterase